MNNMKLLLVLSYIIYVNSFQISSSNHIKRYIKVTMNFNDYGYGLMGSLISTFMIWRIYQYNILGIDYKDNFWGF